MKRRTILSGLALAGAGAGLGGIGTRALFSDEEGITTSFTAGSVDIKLEWQAFHNGEEIASVGPTDNDGQVGVSFPDVKPGDEGCFSIGLHNNTNPAWVWLAMDLDGGPSDGCPIMGYPLICGQEPTDGSVTVTTDGNNIIVEFYADTSETFTETHLHIADDEGGIPQNNGNPNPGGFDYDSGDAVIVEDSYVKYVIPFDSDISCGDNLAIAAHGVADDGETCWAGTNPLLGHNWAVYMDYTVCCPSQTGDLKYLTDKILVDVFWDSDSDCEFDSGDDEFIFENISLTQLADNLDKSDCGIRLDEFEEGHKTVSISWKLPSDIEDNISGQSFNMSFSSYAEQRRHNSNPDCPWS